MFMHLQCTLDDENRAENVSFLIPLTLALSHPGMRDCHGVSGADGSTTHLLKLPGLFPISKWKEKVDG
jgi:hypothetical protein